MLTTLSADIGKKLAEALTPEKIKIFDGFEVGPSLLVAYGVTVFLLLLALILRLTVVRKMTDVPKKPQLILEMLVGTFDKMAKENTGVAAGFVGPFIMSSSMYICLGVLVELLGVRPALADINSCLALGLTAFAVIQIWGVKKHKLSRLKRFANPINIITDIAVPVSLSFRLFGSIVSGLLLTELVYGYLATSFVLPAFISVITTLFHALIQAYIYATLVSLFVGEAVEDVEPSAEKLQKKAQRAAQRAAKRQKAA